MAARKSPKFEAQVRFLTGVFLTDGVSRSVQGRLILRDGEIKLVAGYQFMAVSFVQNYVESLVIALRPPRCPWRLGTIKPGRTLSYGMNNKDTDRRDYVLLMLGAPIIKVELDDQQLRLAIAEARKWTEAFRDHPEATQDAAPYMEERLIREAALILSKRMLGRIRGKFLGDTLLNDAESLLLSKEAQKEWPRWQGLAMWVYGISPEEAWE